MLKRYLVLAGYHYYPSGGWGDFVDSFETIDEAEAHAKKEAPRRERHWWHIVDSATGEIVREG